jgi:hypothetical protein
VIGPGTKLSHFDVPVAIGNGAQAYGINDSGQIVGDSSLGAFVDTSGSITTIDVPGNRLRRSQRHQPALNDFTSCQTAHGNNATVATALIASMSFQNCTAIVWLGARNKCQIAALRVCIPSCCR